MNPSNPLATNLIQWSYEPFRVVPLVRHCDSAERRTAALAKARRRTATKAAAKARASQRRASR